MDRFSGLKGKAEPVLAMLKPIDRFGTRELAYLQMKHAMVANNKRSKLECTPRQEQPFASRCISSGETPRSTMDGLAPFPVCYSGGKLRACF